MKVLLLGSSGFIGKPLGEKLDELYDVVKVNRHTNLDELFKTEKTYDYVINCVSSKFKSESNESVESNFRYPTRIFKTISTAHWIQLESYFQLQIPMGRSDSYTIEKQRFSEYLDRESKVEYSPAIHHLYMPHVFGKGDREDRLISSAILSFRSGKILKTSHGSQFLPLLHVDDSVEGIVQFIQKPRTIASCRPFWYGRLKELIQLISAEYKGSEVCYGGLPEPIDAEFPKVDFPEKVEGWEPRMQMEQFLDWIKENRE